MKCGGYGNTISTKLAELDHIEEIVFNPEEDTVTFLYNDQIDSDKAVALLSKLGYLVSGAHNSL